MKLITDDRCRIQSRELFKPNTAYQAERKANGRVELVELIEKDVPVVKAVRTKEGFIMFPPGKGPGRGAIRAFTREDRDKYQ